MFMINLVVVRKHKEKNHHKINVARISNLYQ